MLDESSNCPFVLIWKNQELKVPVSCTNNDTTQTPRVCVGPLRADLQCLQWAAHCGPQYQHASLAYEGQWGFFFVSTSTIGYPQKILMGTQKGKGPLCGHTQFGISVGLPWPQSPTVYPQLPTVGPHKQVWWVKRALRWLLLWFGDV